MSVSSSNSLKRVIEKASHYIFHFPMSEMVLQAHYLAARRMPSVANSLYRYGECDRNPLKGLKDEDLRRMDQEIAQRMQAQDTTLNVANMWVNMTPFVSSTASVQRGNGEEDDNDKDEDEDEDEENGHQEEEYDSPEYMESGELTM
jgi:hypothetical protein